jgi:hypothetical protein
MAGTASWRPTSPGSEVKVGGPLPGQIGPGPGPPGDPPLSRAATRTTRLAGVLQPARKAGARTPESGLILIHPGCRCRGTGATVAYRNPWSRLDRVHLVGGVRAPPLDFARRAEKSNIPIYPSIFRSFIGPRQASRDIRQPESLAGPLQKRVMPLEISAISEPG